MKIIMNEHKKYNFENDQSSCVVYKLKFIVKLRFVNTQDAIRRRRPGPTSPY